MKLFQRRTALIIISALVIQTACLSFAFADDTDFDKEPRADVTSIYEDNSKTDMDGAEPYSDAKTQEQSDEGEHISPNGDQNASESEHSTLESEQDPSESEQDTDDGKDDKSDEKPLNGWVKKKGHTYYYVKGKIVTGMKHIGKHWYFFKDSGVMKTGWLTKNGKRYYFNLSNGRRETGKLNLNGKVYYFRKSGIMVKGWLKVKGKKYYHDPSNGKRLFGSRKIGKYRYYFKPKNGIMKKGWLKLKGKKYYYDKKGHKLFGVQKIGSKTYYLNKTTGAKMSKGSYYLYNKIWSKSSSTGWLIYVSKGGRWVNVFKGSKENWTIVKRCRCSIGAPSTPTPSGTYKVTSKVYHFGESKGYTCWYATGFIGTTYLMHSVVCYSGTKTPSDGRLGMAISHGCVRMKLGNAKWIYDHVPGGSTVYIS